MNYLGLALIAGGVAWWFFTRTPRSTAPQLSNDGRNGLFNCYLTLNDHVAKAGTPEQKAALLTILPCIAQKEAIDAVN